MGKAATVLNLIATHKTDAPTGLSIKRNDNKFTFTWKIGDADYAAGQSLQWRIHSKIAKGEWQDISVGTKTTAKAVTITWTGYYPSTILTLKAIEFRVRGKRKDYSTQNKKKTKTTLHMCSVSDWASKTYTFAKPDKPTGSTNTTSDGNTNTTTFTVSEVTTAEGTKAVRRLVYQSVRVANCNYTDGSKAPWKDSTAGWQTGTLAASGGSVTIAESSMTRSQSYTRWFRVMAQGPSADSDWTYFKHVYAAPLIPVINSVKVSAGTPTRATFDVTMNWTADNTVKNPIDYVKVYYLIAVPAAGVTPPSSGVTWTEVAQLKDTAKKDGLNFHINDGLDAEECLFVRVAAYHDGWETISEAKRVAVGTLKTPTITSVSLNTSTHVATFNITNNSDVSDSFIYITLTTPNNMNGYGLTAIPSGQSSVTAYIPSSLDGSEVTYVAEALVGSYVVVNANTGSRCTVSNVKMRSDPATYGGTVPAVPVITLASTSTAGTIRVTYTSPWTRANCAELSWADHEDAWQSTDEPDSYLIQKEGSGAWNISGLETGKTWYVRARLGIVTDSSETWGGYSVMRSIKLASAPVKPVLTLSKGIMTPKDTVEASWTYVTTDGAQQGQAVVAEVTVVNSSNVYTPIATATTQQHVTISAGKLGWINGSTHNLAVRVTSANGQMSDDWSDPVPIIVANAVNASITATSLQTVTVTVDGESTTYNGLTVLPLTLTVTGAGTGGITTVVIERAEEYHVARPDESIFNGYEGETIALWTQKGEAQISIGLDDLFGSLDDGALYRIVATVQDSYGQTATATRDFLVKWTDQALIPDAEVTIDDDNMIAVITPAAPAGASQTATCDIYRLSVDKPTLIYKDAEFGTDYVDPFPTIGPLGGHRVVYKTAAGDYITVDNELAWIDLRDPEGDSLDSDYNIIDWDTGRVLLEHNVNISQSWKKDFKETKYLGGAVQGDWNPAVSRTGSVGAVAVTTIDDDIIQAMRRLAVYPGICHIRTKDGSSYAADVQVSEDVDQDAAHRIVEFSLTITRVDSEGLDGMTLEEWEQTQEAEGGTS